MLDFVQNHDIPTPTKIRGILSAMVASIGTLLPNITIFRDIILRMQTVRGHLYNAIVQMLAAMLASIFRADCSHKTTQLIQVPESFPKWNPKTATFEKKVSKVTLLHTFVFLISIRC